MGQENGIEYPWIVFKANDGLYCVNSRDVMTIMQMPPSRPLPGSPPCITGMFTYRDNVYQILDLRLAFGMDSLRQESQSFTGMIDQRKEDHVHWVNELEKSAETGAPFCLATDPHQCAFGKWYDNFRTQSSSVRFVLDKIAEPHRKLHEAALHMIDCQQNCDECSRAECLKDIMHRARQQYMPEILSLLDQTKEIFLSNVYREMVLILSGEKRVGVLVDEVLTVEHLEPLNDDQSLAMFGQNSHLSGVWQRAGSDKLIFEIDPHSLVGLAKDDLNEPGA